VVTVNYTISTRRLRTELSRVLHDVNKKRSSFTILNHSTPVAVLVPLGTDACARKPRTASLAAPGGRKLPSEPQAILAVISEHVEPLEPGAPVELLEPDSLGSGGCVVPEPSESVLEASSTGAEPEGEPEQSSESVPWSQESRRQGLGVQWKCPPCGEWIVGASLSRGGVVLHPKCAFLPRS
jgi:antitoxin (DNA-binding transcriptional repressor) of toxin-antitoxin stability system